MNVGTLSQLSKKDTVQHQYYLEKLLHEAFPGVAIHSNVRKEGQFVNPSTGSFLEVDLWVPELLLGFEFQDAHHYVSTWYYNNPLSAVRVRDNMKTMQGRTQGITMLTIPCWWDASPDSLFATILFQRPDLFNRHHEHHNRGGGYLSHLKLGDPIPNNPSPSFFAPATIPDVGELMLASFVSFQVPTSNPALSLAAKYPWWLGEKYDGVRCVWHPHKQNLYTRHRYTLPLLPSIRSQLTRIKEFFEGEIWNGRGCYQESYRVVRSSIDADSQRIVVFDNPQGTMHTLPFEQRYFRVIKSIPSSHPLAIPAMRLKVKTEQSVRWMVEEIMREQGEGVVLRATRSVYEPGRSDNLLKIKSSREDMEALVLETGDEGCLVQFANGTKLQLVNRQISIINTLSKGAVVLIEYDHFSSSDLPVNPVLVRVREDLEWQDVLRDFIHNTLSNDAEETSTRKPNKFWTVEEGRNARKFLEDFAKSKNMDPLLPDTWYSTQMKDIFLHTGEQPAFFRRGYVKVLMELFPELDLQETKFITAPIRYYSEVKNRRAFFDTFARDHHFDPLISDNWHRVNAYHMRERKGSDAVLFYYQGSMTRALSHLYPQLTFDLRNYTKRKRLFFVKFAQERGFDPLVANNWYAVVREDLQSRKGFEDIVKEYGGSFVKALIGVFPNINLKTSKFSIPGRKHWSIERNRKMFFDQYAKDHAFDPLHAENWYSIKSEKILSRRHSSMVIRYYGGSVRRALMRLYPNIGLQDEKFESRGRAYWAVESNRRKYFDDFARHHHFDPLIHSNWYSINVAQLRAFKKCDFLYRYHKNLEEALTQLYPNIGLNFEANMGRGQHAG